MTQSTRAVDPDDELAPATMAVHGGTHESVRQLLTELAALEDATRGPGGSADLLAALAREQEIIDELHRRCPQGTRQAPWAREGF